MTIFILYPSSFNLWTISKSASDLYRLFGFETIFFKEFWLKLDAKNTNVTEVLAKELVGLIVSGFKNLGYNIVDVSPKGSYGVNAQLVAEYTAANAVRGAQLHLCVHFNASNGAGHGTESWIYAHGNAANVYANAITNAIANCAGFTNRGVKASGNSLCIPRRVNQPVVLIETCFIDNRGDMDKYIANKAKIASAIVNSLTGGHVSVGSPAPSKPSNPTPAPTNDPVKKGKE